MDVPAGERTFSQGVREEVTQNQEAWFFVSQNFQSLYPLKTFREKKPGKIPETK